MITDEEVNSFSKPKKKRIFSLIGCCFPIFCYLDVVTTMSRGLLPQITYDLFLIVNTTTYVYICRLNEIKIILGSERGIKKETFDKEKENRKGKKK